MKHELSDKWIKAAIAGTIWAASEIVLGSFLHNLRVPLSGNILTAIGLIILISISFTWNDKGLFWRAGVICAIMKTMSPSAVIFGPMIAIIAESLLLELFTRLLGRTYAGYLIGAMFAVSWNLFQKIAKYILFYGTDIVGVYSDLLKFAQKQLNIQSDIVWLPIFILLAIYALFGLVAAIIGIRVGEKIKTRPAPPQANKTTNHSGKSINHTPKEFNYSVLWLITDIVMIIGSLVLMSLVSWIISSATITIVIIIMVLRYRSSLRRISNPKFWITFILITLFTAFAFTIAQSGERDLINGLITGIQMNFRAALIIIGFSGIGTELYNPAIRNFFSRTSFRNLPVAVELSAESLPDFIASIPDFRTLIRNPVSVFHNVISHAGTKLIELKKQYDPCLKVYIVSGPRYGGKTTFLKSLTVELQRKSTSIGGILAERVMDGPTTTGYDLINLMTGEKEIFLRQNQAGWNEKIGKFHINCDGLKFGERALNPENLGNVNVVVVDEVGRLEIEGDGWASSLQKLIEACKYKLIICVRDTYTEEVIRKWGLKNPVIIKVQEYKPAEAATIIDSKPLIRKE